MNAFAAKGTLGPLKGICGDYIGVYIGVILGLYYGYIGAILGLYRLLRRYNGYYPQHAPWDLAWP